jgi:hypothetical protein
METTILKLKDNLDNSNKKLLELTSEYENLKRYLLSVVKGIFPNSVPNSEVEKLSAQELAIHIQNRMDYFEYELKDRDKIITVQKEKLDKIEAERNSRCIVEEDLGNQIEPDHETPMSEQPEEEHKGDDANTSSPTKIFKINRRKVPVGMKEATMEELQNILRMYKLFKLTYEEVYYNMNNKFTLEDITKFCKSH